MYGLYEGEFCEDGYTPLPMFDSEFAFGIVCVAKCPDEFFQCGHFCVPLEVPICNPLIAKKSIDSLHIRDRKLKLGDKKNIHGGSGSSPFGSLPFTNDEENDAILDAKLAIQAEAIASWSDWNYPICDEKQQGTH